MDADVRAAVLKSHLRELPLDVVEEGLDGCGQNEDSCWLGHASKVNPLRTLSW